MIGWLLQKAKAYSFLLTWVFLIALRINEKFKGSSINVGEQTGEQVA